MAHPQLHHQGDWLLLRPLLRKTPAPSRPNHAGWHPSPSGDAAPHRQRADGRNTQQIPDRTAGTADHLRLSVHGLRYCVVCFEKKLKLKKVRDISRLIQIK